MDSTALGPAFFAADTRQVARALLGAELVAGPVVLRVAETEAYRAGDTACHAHRGWTPRNAPMWGPPGVAYVYLCYGLHVLLNLVSEPEGTPACVLVRAAVPVAGLETVRARRGGRLDLDGPGKVGAALGLRVADSGAALGGAGPVAVRAGRAVPDAEVVVGPRIGIEAADAADRALPWNWRWVGPEGLRGRGKGALRGKPLVSPVPGR